MASGDIHQEIVDRIRVVYPEVERIVLFGSRSRGESSTDSDFDLLVVTESDLSPARRAAPLHLALHGLGAAFDILVATPEEYRRNLAWRSSVVHTAATEGAVLYEAA